MYLRSTLHISNCYYLDSHTVAIPTGGVSTPASGAQATMGGDLLTPLSAGLEGLSLGGKNDPAYRVGSVCVCVV